MVGEWSSDEVMLSAIADMEMAAELRDWREATAFILRASSPETGRAVYVGPFADVAAALAYRDQMQRDLGEDDAADEGSLPWVYEVEPLNAP